MADQLITGTTLIEDKRNEFGKVWSCLGVNFTSLSPDVDNLVFNVTNGKVLASADNLTLMAPVSLPHGARVSGVIVYGDAAAAAGITWTLERIQLDDLTVGAMASAAVNTEDTTITNGTIDNTNYGYFISMGEEEFDTGDEIYGARIRYD